MTAPLCKAFHRAWLAVWNRDKVGEGHRVWPRYPERCYSAKLEVPEVRLSE